MYVIPVESITKACELSRSLNDSFGGYSNLSRKEFIDKLDPDLFWGYRIETKEEGLFAYFTTSGVGILLHWEKVYLLIPMDMGHGSLMKAVLKHKNIDCCESYLSQKLPWWAGKFLEQEFSACKILVHKVGHIYRRRVEFFSAVYELAYRSDVYETDLSGKMIFFPSAWSLIH